MTFQFDGGRTCLDFANTVSDYFAATPAAEKLAAYGDLLAWATQAGILDAPGARRLAKAAARRPPAAARVLADARRLRGAIFAVFLAAARAESAARHEVAVIDAAARVAAARQGLAAAGGAYALVWDRAEDALDAPLWPIARSAVELLTSPALARVRLCEANAIGCTWLFVDESKNGSRRWCSMRDCGNRAKARRHYQRTKQGV